MSGPRGPAFAALCARAPRGMSLGLGRLRAVLAALGDPQVGLPAVHVAGTNGKGSTCAMGESIARAAGLRTGLYTSPHLCRIAERIRLDGAPIDDDRLERALARVLAAGPELTFFELMTAAAFVVFREAGVDVAVIEVGLGGRLDATNVIDAPLVTAITSIAVEHAAILGNTLAAIAREKAGIVKPGVPVVVGPVAPEAEATILATARERRAGPVLRVVRAAAAEAGPDAIALLAGPRGAVVVQRPDALGGGELRAEIGLPGVHQADNAAVACGIAWLLTRRWPAIERAIADGLATTTWPGRLELVPRDETRVLLDCAHNPHGARALAASMAARPGGHDPSRTVLVFGALADKPFEDMLAVLAPLAARRVYATPKGRTPAALDALEAVAPGEVAADGAAALARALALASPGDTVLVTGSIYLVGEVRGALLGIDCDPVIAL